MTTTTADEAIRPEGEFEPELLADIRGRILLLPEDSDVRRLVRYAERKAMALDRIDELTGCALHHERAFGPAERLEIAEDYLRRIRELCRPPHREGRLA
jgi:hypothetical protein